MMPEARNENEAEEYALLKCSCPQARDYQKKIQYIAEAKDKLQEIFNLALPGNTTEPTYYESGCELIDILEKSIEYLADYKIRQVMMSIPNIGKIVIAVGADGKIKIKRSMTFSYESKV